MHVWRADLNDAGDELVELLSATEHTRAAAIAGERQRLLWSRSRGVLRELLGRYLREDACAIELAVGAHGKPRLVGAHSGLGDGGESELHFNLSHSRDLALYAFAATGPVGVDVQFAREHDDASHTDEHNSGRGARKYVALARRTFGEDSAERLAALDYESREREFLRLWTRHEAELKRIGLGIGGGAQDAANGEAAANRSDGAAIVELDAAPDAAAALALGWRASELRRWDWR